MQSLDIPALLASPALRSVAAFMFGVLCAALVASWRGARRMATVRADCMRAAAELRQLEVGQLEGRLAERSQELARLDGRVEVLTAQAAQREAERAEAVEALAAYRAGEAALAARLEESRRAVADKEALIQAQGEALRRDFEVLAGRIFSREGEQQKARLASVLEPLREQLSDFRSRVETVYTTETRDRASLLTEVRNLQQASERVNREAGNLARALKGDVKAQGNWGELVLERVLESSGLRAGHEYVLQTPVRTDAGALRRPDAVIRLPDGKDVIVDAKLSLVAWEQALAADTQTARQAAMRDHVTSMRGHVRRLALQDYDRLPDLRSLDFVLLFVPIEAAFSAAMEHESSLFNEAFARRIVIVSPTTLMMTLRIIQNVWRYEKQNRNAEEIARRAGALYDKVRGLVEDLDTLGRQLQTVDGTYRAALSKLTSGRGNIIRQVEQFRELGADIKRPIAQGLRDEALDDERDPL